MRSEVPGNSDQRASARKELVPTIKVRGTPRLPKYSGEFLLVHKSSFAPLLVGQ